MALVGELLDRLNKTAPDNFNSPQLLAEIREKALIARGNAQMQLKNYAAARQDFESARDVAPSDPTPYNSLLHCQQRRISLTTHWQTGRTLSSSTQSIS
jgi:Tfp pilus assembly protein PilF